MKKWAKLSIALLIILIGVTVFSENLKPYPKTRTVDVVDDYFGVKVKDPYRWLENTKSKEVQEWIDAQNKYTDEYMKNVPQVKALLKRLKKHDAYDEDSIPTRVYGSNRIFFFRKLQGKDKRLYCMKENENSKAIILIDPNTWPEEELLGEVVPSHDGKYVTFEKSRGGGEVSTIYLLDCKTKDTVDCLIEGFNTKHVSWHPENTGFYYSAYKYKKNKTHNVYFHDIGNNTNSVMFSNKDDKNGYNFAFVDTESKNKYITFYSFKSNGTKNIYILDSTSNKNDIKLLISDVMRSSYLKIIDNIGYLLLFMKDNQNGIIYKVDLNKINKENWQVFVKGSKGNRIYEITGAGGKIVVNYFKNAHSSVKVYNTSGIYENEIALPMLCTAEIYGIWNSSEINILVRSFFVRRNYYSFNLKNNKTKLMYSRINTSKYNADEISVKQVWYKSKDGTDVSMFLVYKKDLKLNGNNPVLIFGYGSSSVSITPFYNLTTAILVENGGVFCVPNLRGGGEYGFDWYMGGFGRKKQNTIDDFIYATKWLIENKYSNPKKIAIYGGSAGGIVIGGAITQNPELYKAALIIKPIQDMIRYNKFRTYKRVNKEYGNPDDMEDFKVIQAISPYNNLKEKTNYPSVFITGAENDIRVGVTHALKMGARLQNSSISNLPVLIQIEKKSGHLETASKKESFKYFTQQFGFLFSQIGIEF